MSENENNGAVATAAPADEKTGGMPESDVKFLVVCLQNTTGGSISIDNTKVAEVLNFKNPKSVSNKIAAFKKKYDLPFGTSAKAATPSKAAIPSKAGASSRKASDTAGPNEPAVPTTPSKQRVSKARNTSSTKKNVTPKKGGKKGKVEDDASDEQGLKNEDDALNDGENLAVQESKHQANYEAVFGKADTDEEGADGDDEDS